MVSSASSRMRRWLLPGIVVLTVAVAAACTSGVSAGSGKGTSDSPVPLQDSYESVVRAVLPSVVQITAGSSTGSGVVFDGQGDIVTNEHVVGDAKSAEVREAVGNRDLTAKVIGKFAPDDLAVIRVTQDASSLKPAKFVNSNDAQIGEIVLAMGNPLGLTDSVTQGIISATGRTVGASEPGGQALITGAIQTSAAINPGNSGGALVNLEDEVIGIPTLAARLPEEGGGAAPGIGFAIPSDTVMNIADQLIKSGKVTNSDRATLDITAQTVANPQGEPTGVAVLAATKGGAAANAGLKSGDIIVSVNGEDTPSVQDLQDVLSVLKPGEKVTLVYTDNGVRHTTTAKLGSLGS